jgi:hypothetical protein
MSMPIATIETPPTAKPGRLRPHQAGSSSRVTGFIVPQETRVTLSRFDPVSSGLCHGR